MTKLHDVSSPFFAIRSALETFTQATRRLSFDSLSQAERHEVMLDLAADDAKYADHDGLPGHHIARAAAVAVDPSVLDDTATPENMTHLERYVQSRGPRGGRGA